MAPESMRAPLARAFALAAVLALTAGTAHAFRIVNYNLLNYPGNTSAARNPLFRTIFEPLAADVVVTQEQATNATFPDSSGPILFRDQVLNTLEPGSWAMAPYFNGNDTDNQLYYRRSRVTLLGAWAFYPNAANQLRFVAVYRLKVHGYDNVEFRVYSQHLKASSGSANEAQRLAEAIGIRDSMNAVPPGTHCILMGDFNIYSGNEGAFLKFKEIQADNDGRLYDPLNAPAITWNTASLAAIHTQSPCNGSGCASGAATGGMDDRFDMFLPTLNMSDSEGLDLLVGSYVPIGNDGLHYNLAVNAAPTIPEGAAYANALIGVSDHLPIRVDLQLPAKGSAPAALAFGTVITGATAQQTLTVGNQAAGPGDVLDELNATLVAPVGFTLDAGAAVVAPGASVDRTVGMLTATEGVKSGDVVMTSDDPDAPTRNVALSGTVLRHASASLDSLVATTTGLLDFGTHEAGGFSTLEARVHNALWDALQAQLSVTAATLTGGAGRFTLTAPFTPVQLAGVGHTVGVAFDDAGATTDSLYEATLTFTSTDEALPGAAAAADVVVTLRAQVQSGGPVGTPGQSLPTATLLFAPSPNPMVGESRIRFDVAERADVAIEAFDLAGRRVASLTHAPLEAGRYSVAWNGRGESGAPLGAGLYFVRMTVGGRTAQTVRLAITR